MDNNVSSTSPVPIFVPRIVMVATYTQDTQTHSITASVSTQTDSNLLNTHATQTNQTTSRNEQTQTFPALTSISIQTENTLTQNTSVTDVIDHSSPELDNLEETQQLPRHNLSRKRKNHSTSDKQKQEKKVRFGKDKQNKSKVTTNTIIRPESPVIDLTQQETIPFHFLQEHTQSLETFSTSKPLLINIQDIDISTVQPMNIEQPQPIQHPTTFQKMSSQQRAALTNAALINFFGNAGTVGTIMQTVQQTQQQTEQYTLGTNLIPTEQCQQLLPVVATDSEEDSGTSNSLDITQQNNSLDITQQNNSLDITQQDNAQPEQQISHIQSPTSTPTSTITNSTLTTTQSDYTRQSYRVPSYYANSLSYINSRRRRQMHTQTQNKERKHKKKDDN